LFSVISHRIESVWLGNVQDRPRPKTGIKRTADSRSSFNPVLHNTADYSEAQINQICSTEVESGEMKQKPILA